MTGLDPFSSVSFIRLLIVYGNVGHILILGVGEKLGISRHCEQILPRIEEEKSCRAIQY